MTSTGNVTYGKAKTVHLTVRNRGGASLCGAWKRAEESGTAKHATEAEATCKTCLKARENGSQEAGWTPETVTETPATETPATETQEVPAMTTTTPETTTDRPNYERAPRGKNQRERWYRDHTRAGEILFVIELPNGAIAKHHGALAVSDRRDVMEKVIDRYSGTNGPRPGWAVRTWTFEEGAHVTRLADFAAVDAML